MSLLRRCRVNAALTIQLFSQLFHYVNMWLFNKLVLEPRRQLCTRAWGHRLKRRLGRIEIWAEKQGLELAADCHLARIIQVFEEYAFMAPAIRWLHTSCVHMRDASGAHNIFIMMPYAEVEPAVCRSSINRTIVLLWCYQNSSLHKLL